jgi:hypothetical protein
LIFFSLHWITIILPMYGFRWSFDSISHHHPFSHPFYYPFYLFPFFYSFASLTCSFHQQRWYVRTPQKRKGYRNSLSRLTLYLVGFITAVYFQNHFRFEQKVIKIVIESFSQKSFFNNNFSFRKNC